MRILIINYEYPPLGGGAAQASQNLALQLTKMGHQVSVLTARYKSYVPTGSDPILNIYTVKSWRKSIHDCGILGAISFILFAIPIFFKLVWKNQYDIIHYFFSLPTGILSLLPGKHNQTKSIVSLRGSDVPGYDPYNKSLQVFHRLLKPITRKIWKKADHVVAVTNSLKELANLTSACIDIKVVPNGVASHFFEVKKKQNKDLVLKLVCVARLIERKGIQYLLKALHKLKSYSINLTIIGEGNYQDSLEKISLELDLNNRVTFVGFKAPDAVSKYLAEADIFVLPSLSEAFGNAFAEAMATGLPIIATKVGGIQELVGSENGILVDPNDQIVNSLSNAIEYLSKHPEIRKEMGKKNALKMAKNYSWDQIAQQFIKLYY